MDATEWSSQVRRGILEFCVLTLISVRPCYGYDLITRLSRWDRLTVSEGTLYPLLRRLQKDGQIESFWQESEAGPPRKYYQLTTQGQSVLDMMAQEWAKLTYAVKDLYETKGAQ